MDSKEKREWEYVVRIMLTAIGSYGIIRVMTSCAMPEVSDLTMAIGIAIYSTLAIVGMYTKNITKVFYISTAVCACVLGVFFSHTLQIGIRYIYNDCVQALERAYGLELEKLEVVQRSETNIEETIAMLFLAAIVVLVVAAVVLYVHGMLGALLSILPVLILFISMAAIPDIWALLFCVSYVFGVSALFGEHGGEKQALSIMIICVAIAFFIMFFIPRTGFVRLSIFQEANAYAKEKFSWIGNETTQNIAGIADGGINNGELGKVDGIKYTNEVLFNLRTVSTGKNQYLPQFRGSIYEDGQWRKADKDALANTTDLIMNLAERYPAIQDYFVGPENDFYDVVKRFTYTIQYERAAGYKYKDTYNDMKNPDFTKFVTFVNQGVYFQTENAYDTGQKMPQNGILYSQENFAQQERVIRNAAQTIYTTISPEDKALMQSLLGNREVRTVEQKEDYIRYVKDFLNENYTYDMVPGRLPENKNFLEYFLLQNKRGYCTYFATAATLMYRAVGIPARYVEGYVVTNDKIVEGTKEEGYVERYRSGGSKQEQMPETFYHLDVTDTAAHAWVEVYMDGYGWIPVEVTPAAAGVGGVAVDGVSDARAQESSQSEQEQLQSQTKAVQADEDKSEQDTSGAEDATVEEIQNQEVESEETAYVEHQNHMAAMIGIVCIIIVVGSFLIPVCRYRAICLQRRKQKQAGDELTVEARAVAVLEEYQRVEKMIAYIGYKRPQGVDYEAYAIYLEDVSEVFSGCQMKNLTELALRARFAKDTITSADLSDMHRLCEKLRRTLYQELKWYQKLYVKYIRVF